MIIPAKPVKKEYTWVPTYKKRSGTVIPGHRRKLPKNKEEIIDLDERERKRRRRRLYYHRQKVKKKQNRKRRKT